MYILSTLRCGADCVHTQRLYDVSDHHPRVDQKYADSVGRCHVMYILGGAYKAGPGPCMRHPQPPPPPQVLTDSWGGVSHQDQL